MPLFVTLGQGFTQIGVGAKVQWGLAFLVLDIQVSSVCGQEAGNRRTGLLVGSRSSQAH